MLVDRADVVHPAPGADGRPSFTALVANVDSDSAKYVAECRVQTSRKEMIEDLQEMSHVCSISLCSLRTADKRVRWRAYDFLGDVILVYGVSRTG